MKIHRVPGPRGRAAIPKGDLTKSTLTERVFQTLRRDIITGFFKPGEGLTENMLARRYSTSRTPVRQAAARAQQENLLRFVPNKGYFVNLVTMDELNELYQFRAIVEGACAELAAQKEHSPSALERLRRNAVVKYKKGNRKSYVSFIQADRAFHVGIAQLTRNRFLIGAVEDLRNWLDRFLYSAIEVGDYSVLLADHEEIYRAIKSRDPELARKLMLEHVLESKAKVFESM
jgi:DNA-binding GntR family transcriptional regulator